MHLVHEHRRKIQPAAGDRFLNQLKPGDHRDERSGPIRRRDGDQTPRHERGVVAALARLGMNAANTREVINT